MNCFDKPNRLNYEYLDRVPIVSAKKLYGFMDPQHDSDSIHELVSITDAIVVPIGAELAEGWYISDTPTSEN